METPEYEAWFALYVKPKHEKCVSTLLRAKGYETLLPLYAKKTKSRISELPLFPGYVFCRFDLTNRLPVVSVPGVFSIVGQRGKPVPVANSEIDGLQRVVRHKLVCEALPAIPSGTAVTVCCGPMEGIRGIVIKHKNMTRVIINITLLQRAIAVDVDRASLEVDPGAMTAREAACLSAVSPW
jgi:transcription antitermination factor NusG